MPEGRKEGHPSSRREKEKPALLLPFYSVAVLTRLDDTWLR